MRDPEIHCSRDEGVAFRHGVYRPLDVDALPAAPVAADFPDPGHGEPFRRFDTVPKVPRLRDVVGPSIIALGMGLGAGELLLWPNLIAVNGFSIWWLFWVGVLSQFVVISEIERWTIATGESILVGMGRLTRRPVWPWFFLVATLASFFWPGWASESALLVVETVNTVAGHGTMTAWQPLALAMLAVIWAGLAFSRIVYNALERFEIALVLLFFPLLLAALAFAGISPGDLVALAKGSVSIGRVPPDLLSGDQFPTLLIAVAYAGSGGTLLLVQSLWIRDKGFGMGAHQGRIAGIRGENEPLAAPGFAFSTGSRTAVARFRAWMGLAERELLFTFVVLILLSVVITTLVVAATIGTGHPELAGDLYGTVFAQAEVLHDGVGAWMALLFLVGGAFVLFSTQVAIVDTVTRLTGDIVHDRVGRARGWTLKRTFLVLLTGVVLASAFVVALSWALGEDVKTLEPDFLVIIAGPFTITSMYAFAAAVAVLNATRLPPPMRPGRWKLAGMWWAIVLWGWFTAETVSRFVLSQILDLSGPVVSSIALHPVRIVAYGLWILSLAWVIARTAPPVFGRDRALD